MNHEVFSVVRQFNDLKADLFKCYLKNPKKHAYT